MNDLNARVGSGRSGCARVAFAGAETGQSEMDIKSVSGGTGEFRATNNPTHENDLWWHSQNVIQGPLSPP